MHVMLAKPRVESGFLPTSVIKKSAVAVDQRILALMKNGLYCLAVQQRMKRRAVGILHAVIGPEGLRQAVELPLAVRFCLMLTGEAPVVRRVPVLACEDRITTGLAPCYQLVCDINGAVALRDRQRAAGAEIVL